MQIRNDTGAQRLDIVVHRLPRHARGHARLEVTVASNCARMGMPNARSKSSRQRRRRRKNSSYTRGNARPMTRLARAPKLNSFHLFGLLGCVGTVARLMKLTLVDGLTEANSV